tara:strand:+ start:352 stop:816 length:465 start_codon:yes stop_codon:yes gene_type:complete
MKHFWNLVHMFENFLLVFFIGSIIVFSAGQIIVRNIFDLSYTFVDPLIRHLVLWTGLWGSLVATREEKNLRIEILHFTSKPVKKSMTFVGQTISFGVCSLLTYHAMRFVEDEYTYGGIAFASLPSWSVLLIFPIVFFFLSVRFLILSIKTIQYS